MHGEKLRLAMSAACIRRGIAKCDYILYQEDGLKVVSVLYQHVHIRATN